MIGVYLWQNYLQKIRKFLEILKMHYEHSGIGLAKENDFFDKYGTKSDFACK